jgi:hypothetical protein
MFHMKQQTFHVGCGAGFSGDRTDTALPVVETLIANRGPAALVFETLAERTLALAHQAKQADPAAGYEPLMAELLEPVLGLCLTHDIPILANFGAANPLSAARCVANLAGKLGLKGVRIGIVEGDDLLAHMSGAEVMRWQVDAPAGCRTEDMISANVYLGAEPIAEALLAGANVVVTGRVADPSLVLAPVANHFGWDWDDWDRLATGILAGHLLECAGQVTGGYFADPGFKDVSDPAWIGFPIAAIESHGELTITKAANTGGLVSRATVVEQILYEVHDPSAYLTPDVVLDVTQVDLAETDVNRVRVWGARGRPRPDRLKATIGLEDGWKGEGEISYAGPNAVARARLAASILNQRVRRLYPDCQLRTDIIGVCSLFNDDAGLALRQADSVSHDVRVRLAVHSMDPEVVELATREVLSLYTCGPAGGGGVRTSVTPRVTTVSALVPRDLVKPRVTILEADHD